MRKILLVFIILPLVCCGRGGKAQNEAPKEIKIPAVPTIYSSNEQRAEYLAKHYWDNFDFSDTTYINLPDLTEQTFANYIYILNNMPYGIAAQSVRNTAEKAEVCKQMSDYFNELFEQYLYEPNSPMRNEELYIPLLEHIVNSGKYEDIEKLRPAAQLKMALKNRPGNPANDIAFTLASGKKMNLYDVKTDYVLLYFSNPDCHNCEEVSQQIKGSQMISMFEMGGKLKIVMIYPDNDLDIWRANLGNVPEEWINGYDAGENIRSEELYDLKAIPTLYLLDKDKKVLVKDAANMLPIDQYLLDQL